MALKCLSHMPLKYFTAFSFLFFVLHPDTSHNRKGWLGWSCNEAEPTAAPPARKGSRATGYKDELLETESDDYSWAEFNIVVCESLSGFLRYCSSD